MVNRPQQVVAIVERIKPLLAGLPAEVQGGVLAECLALWLAGHHIEGDPEATRKMRAELLAVHLQAVRNLTRVNAKILGTSSLDILADNSDL